MTEDVLLKQALEALCLHVEPGLDTSAKPEYCAYAYDSSGTLFGDDRPCLEHRRWTVLYVAPLGQNRIEMRQNIRRAIFDTFGVWPSEDTETDASGQQYLYNFETIGGLIHGANGSSGC